MKILLIKPCWPYPSDNFYSTYNRIWPPLSLANCAALLERAGHSVNILDAHAKRIPAKEIARHVRGYDKIFITSSSIDRWQCCNLNIEPFLSLTKSIREVTENFFIIGLHGTAEPRRIFELTGAKAVVIGEPEFAVLNICQEKLFSEIKGIAYKQNGNFLINEPKAFPLSQLALPAFHLLDFNLYRYEVLGERLALFETSRGCRYNCSFCNKQMYNSKFQTKSIEQVIKELDVGINNFGIKTAYFIDTNFTYNRQMAEKICSYLEDNKYKLKWCCQTRPDLVDEELIEKMAKAGCRIIHFGIESGSLSILNSMNKKLDFKKAKEIIRIACKFGIKTVCFFILGWKNEQKKDRLDTLKVAKELNPAYISYRLSIPFLSNDSIKAVKSDIRKAFIDFYILSPYILKRLISTNPIRLLKEIVLFSKILKRNKNEK